jgi:hypothetical protein
MPPYTPSPNEPILPVVLSVVLSVKLIPPRFARRVGWQVDGTGGVGGKASAGCGPLERPACL